MASHLSVVTAPGQTGGFRSAASSQAEAPADPLGIFSAMLEGNLGRGQAAPSTTAAETESLPGLVLERELALLAEGEEDPAESKELGDLLDALSALDIAQQTGQAPDPALLQKLDGLLGDLSGVLGIDLSGLNLSAADGAIPAAPSAGAPGTIDPASMLGQLTQKLAGLAEGLKGQSPELAAKLQALGDKLASGEVGGEALAKLGFDAELKLTDKDLRQALEALVAHKPVMKAAGAADPALAEPSLDATETPLMQPQGKPAVETAGTSERPADIEIKVAPAQKAAKEDKNVAPQDGALPKPDAAGAAEMSAGGSEGDPAIEAPHSSQPVTARTELASAARAVQAPYSTAQSQINLPSIAFEIARQVQGGGSRFEIRLDPPELGRIDIQLDMDNAGNVNARLTVEKSETLDLLQRDQRVLERALAQAGLDGAKTSLEFSLKQNPFARQHGEQNQSQGFAFGRGDGEKSEDGAPPPSTTLYRGLATAGGVNIFV